VEDLGAIWYSCQVY